MDARKALSDNRLDPNRLQRSKSGMLARGALPVILARNEDGFSRLFCPRREGFVHRREAIVRKMRDIGTVGSSFALEGIIWSVVILSSIFSNTSASISSARGSCFGKA